MTSEAPIPSSAIFERQAELYAQFAPESFAWKYIEQPAFDRNLPEFYGEDIRALDAGCGEGRVINHLIERGMNAEKITGIDVSATLLDKAKQRIPAASYLHGDIRDITLPDNTFDVITSNMVLEYLDTEGLQNTLANFHGALKDTGVLFFVTTHPFKMSHRQKVPYEERAWVLGKSPWETEVPLFHHTVADLITTTTRSGFSLINCEEPYIDERAKQADMQKYTHYKSTGMPDRLVVKALKKQNNK
jgi:ubiquinone/menaquinone biosynthesis C-methylase UbiE